MHQSPGSSATLFDVIITTVGFIGAPALNFLMKRRVRDVWHWAVQFTSWTRKF